MFFFSIYGENPMSIQWRNPLTGSSEFHLIPEAVENFWGAKKCYLTIDKKGAINNLPEDFQRACSTLDKCFKGLTKNFEGQIWIVKKANQPLSFPGGKIAINESLITRLREYKKSFFVPDSANISIQHCPEKNEEKFAAPLFVEVVHSICRHQGRKMEINGLVAAVFFTTAV